MKSWIQSELTRMPRPKSSALAHPNPEVESFYHLPDGITEQCCCGTACFVARHRNPSRWKKAISGGQRVYCLGKCHLAPASAEDEAGTKISIACPRPVVLERLANGGARQLENYIQMGGYQALEKALYQPRARIIEEIERSELRGRGGAAFSTGRKWRLAARAKSDVKFIIANADEGDPGSYIDRFLIEDDPHCLIEGMALAAHAIGATRGWIYLRIEYPRAAPILQHAIEQARQAGFLGIENGRFAFDLEIVIGAGSYVCGEETALLNSIEGKRPVAMARPPYATEHGLFGKPTLMNNVETFANVPWIVRHGGQAYRASGFSQSRGTKVVSLNSLFVHPGLYEIEFGVPVRHIVEDLGGGLKTGELKGVMIGGPLAGLIPPALLDSPFGFEELQSIGASVGHGGVIAFDEHTSIAELVHYIFSFGAYESCGQCTPCRLGTIEIEQAFQQIVTGRARPLAQSQWNDLMAALKLTSLCGHGIGLAEFAQSISRHYGEELAACFT